MSELALFEALALDRRVDPDGTVCYYNALGQRHRVYGPAIEYPNGSRVWYQHGQRHRLDGPAVERTDGYRAWYQNWQLHRLDGPAVERADGTYEYWLNGRKLSQAQWMQVIAVMEIAND